MDYEHLVATMLQRRPVRIICRGMARRSKSLPPLTPHSRLLARGCIDGRSREGRYLAACRAELAQHVGGNPSPAERVLIDRLAWLQLHVLLIDEQVAGGKPMSDHDRKSYLAFSNAISRGMRALGLKAAAPRVPTMTEYLAGKAGVAA